MVERLNGIQEVRGSTPLISTNASSCGSKRSKEQGVRHKCRSLFLWLAPCRALRSVPIMGTEIVTAHSVRLFRPRFARPYDSPLLWFHHLPKDPIVRVFFLSSRADGRDNGSAPPMTRFSRQSGCTRLRLDTFVSRHSLTAIAVRRLPLSPPVSTEFEHHKDGIYFRQRCCGLCGIQVKKESNEKTVDLFLFRTYFIIISHTICLN